MKTFEQYIEEAVDFRLGGKDNKGETIFKTFTELSKGDIFYMYTINNETEQIAERKYYFLSIVANGNDELDTLIKYKSSPSQALISHTYAPRLMQNEDCSIFIKAFYNWESSYIYSTTKLDKERVRELWKVYREESIKRDKSIIVCESVDFRLGGSQNKDGGVKNFRELEKGDKIYKFVFGRYNNVTKKEVLTFNRIEMRRKNAVICYFNCNSLEERYVIFNERDLESTFAVKPFVDQNVVFTTYIDEEDEIKKLIDM